MNRFLFTIWTYGALVAPALLIIHGFFKEKESSIYWRISRIISMMGGFLIVIDIGIGIGIARAGLFLTFISISLALYSICLDMNNQTKMT